MTRRVGLVLLAGDQRILLHIRVPLNGHIGLIWLDRKRTVYNRVPLTGAKVALHTLI